MEIIRELGAFAGLAAFIGLAVLALLYFAQARDVRRLRENAEFLVDPEAAIGETDVPPPIGAEEVADQPTQARAGKSPAADAEAFRRAELARQAAKRRERFEERRRGGGDGFRVPSTAVIVIGALILLAGIGFGATRLLGGDDEPATGGGGGAGGKGLAAQSVPQLEQRGYEVRPVTNTESAFDTSSVMFGEGSKRCAPEIAKVVGISRTEPMDQEIQGIAEGAAAAVVLGEDQVSGGGEDTGEADSGALGE